MKILISENQLKLLSEQFAPYPTEIEYQQKDPVGYKRSEKFGLLDLYYPNRYENPVPPIKRGRPRLSMSNIAQPSIEKKERPLRLPKQSPEEFPIEIKKRGRPPKFSMMNIVQPPKKEHIRWSLEQIEKIASQYKSRGELARHAHGAYKAAALIPGFLNKLYGKDYINAWTPEKIEKEAKKYNGRTDFAKHSDYAYRASKKYPGLLDSIFPNKQTHGYLSKISTNDGEITVGSWISTHTEDFKVISIFQNHIVGQSFCNPNKQTQINVNDIIDINSSSKDKFNDLKMDFNKYYQEAGLQEDNIIKGRERYKGGSNIIMFLDDYRNPFTSKKDWIKTHSQIGTEDIHTVQIPTYKEFVNHIQSYGLPKQIIFDHDLGKTDKEGMTGCSAAAWLVKYCITNKRRLPKWSISSTNKYGRCCIGNVLRKFEELTNSKSEV